MAIDRRVLRHLYVDEGWTATQIGGHLGVDTTLTTFALHWTWRLVSD